ncbi:S9 family peptidase, partial [candidate division WOR-3 bacterium]|nr:S9 family peptidase [candidate division WOR-3 bacterium]
MKKRNVKAEDFLKLKFVNEVEFSPCGRQFIYTVKRVNKEKNKYFTNLFLAATDNSNTTQFTHGDWNDTSLKWSPNGKWIAFLSDREGKTNIYVIPTQGGESKRITNLEGIIINLAWMPDSKNLIFAFCPAKKDKKKKDKKEAPLVREIDRMYYKADGQGYRPEGKFHLFKINIKSGNKKQLTKGNCDEYCPTPSPDGEKIAFVSNKQKDYEYNMLLIDLWITDKDGKKIKRVPAPKGPKHTLSWSPNGRNIAYVGNEHYKDYTGALNQHLWIVTIPVGKAKKLTRDFDRTVMNVCVDDIGETFGSLKPSWAKDGKEIIFGASDEGNHHLFSCDVKTRKMRKITKGDFQIFSYSYNNTNDKIVYSYSHPTSPANIAVIEKESGKIEFDKNLNIQLLKRLKISKPEKFSFKGTHGDTVYGWILKPPYFRKNKNYPLIVEVHGGPYAQYANSYFHEFQVLAGAGYVVFYSNPHGSQGYGEKFAKTLVNNWGVPDYKDIMNAIDILSRKRFINKKRMGVTGGSYGGFMTNWIVGHTDIFKAACTQRCVSNLISMIGTSDGGFMMEKEFGGPWWKNLDNYWRMSPLKYVKKIKTPLLIIHSENDMRTPIEQAEQLYIALKLQKRKVKFIRYPEESHGLS